MISPVTPCLKGSEGISALTNAEGNPLAFCPEDSVPGDIKHISGQRIPGTLDPVQCDECPGVGVRLDRHLQQRLPGRCRDPAREIGLVLLLGYDQACTDIELGGADHVVQSAQEIDRDLCAPKQAMERIAEVDDFRIEHAADALQAGDHQFLPNAEQVRVA